MARKPEVRYWQSRKGYYCWIRGKQVRLAEGPDDFPDGPTYQAARKRYNELLFGTPVATFRQVVAKHAEWMKQNLAGETIKVTSKLLGAACQDFGDRPYYEITGPLLEAWVVKRIESKVWGEGTARLALTRIMACLRWATEDGIIDRNPVRKVRMPAERSRGVECVLTPEQKDHVVSACNGAARDFVIVLRDTGARPGEIRISEAKHYDPQVHALIIPAASRTRGKTHKTGRYGKDRVIYLKPESVDIVERLCKRHPTGPLFRSGRMAKAGPHKGKCWGWSAQGVVMLFARLRERLGIRHLIAYSFRHTFAVEWLRAGKPIAALAEVLGTSIEMIVKHYGHLAEQRDYLRRLVDE